MAEDTRPYIDQVLSRAESYIGKELTPQEMSTEFAKWDLQTRVAAIEEIKIDGGDFLSVRDAARRHTFERALRTTHETLRKVGR